MCGIAGFISNRDLHTSAELLHTMLERLRHRGPDVAGTYSDGNLMLGHRRLSIMDLSSAADQPMTSADGRFVIVFNGELYNYRELASRYGLNLRTTGDTEVLLELFARKQLSILPELNGMFAAAIWDTSEKKLYLFRDRIGKKPLYYTSPEVGEIYFASELKSLQPVIPNEVLNHQSVYNFLHLGYIPAPDTIYQNVYKLGSGQYAVLDSSGFQVRCWYDPADSFTDKRVVSEKESFQKLEALVTDSVSQRLMSDVPFGSFLSGGVDSSLVTAVAVGHYGQKFNTFSIGFENKKHDESAHARDIAGFLKTNHTEFIISEKEARDHIESVMDHFDEPFSDSSALPVYLVSGLAGKQVSMILSGDGGDELFMGYGAYTWAKRLEKPFIGLAGPAISSILDTFGSDRMKRAAPLFNPDHNRQSHIFSQEQYLFSQKELQHLLKDQNMDFPALKFPEHARLSEREKQAYFDLKLYLPDDLLVKVDRMSMMNSLEVRCPLLDYRIVEFALNLPENLKVRKGESKYLLKQLLYSRVPARFFQRPKRGFSVPLAEWLKGELRYLVEDNLNAAALRKTGILDPIWTEYLKNEFLSGRDYLYNRIWVLVLLQRWMLKNGMYVG